MTWRGTGNLLAASAVIVAVLATALWLLQGSGAAVAVADFSVLVAASTVVAGAAWRSFHTPRPVGWILLAACAGLFFLAEAYWTWTEVVLQAEVPSVSVADGLYYAGYAFLLGSLIAFFPNQASLRGRLRRVVDALGLAALLLAIAWIAVLRDVSDAAGAGLAESLVAVAYPVLDLALAAVLLVLALECSGAARRRMALLGAGLAAWMVGDLAYAYQVVSSEFASGLPLDVAWVAGYLLWAVAAIAKPEPETQERPILSRNSRASMYLVYSPLVVLLPLVIWDFWQTQRIDVPFFGLGVMILVVLVSRQVLLSGDLLQGQRHELEVERLQAIAAFKTQFLNNAAHELATPITPLKLQLAALRAHKDALPHHVRESLDLLSRNIDRMGLLVNDLLDAARLQGGRMALAFAPTSLPAVAREACASLAEQARQAGVDLAMDPPAGDVVVQGDAVRLGQVAFNLVHNALKFTPRGGTVRVHTGQEGSSAVLRVRDDGIGLTADQRARLFQPFMQVHDPLKVRVAGTGLGLYISKGITEEHGGTLGCRSDGPGRGATFEVRLPVPAA
jgi:signal transduction histidine kinase